MAKGLFMSTGLAVGTGVMTLSALGGIITMAIIFQVQVVDDPPTTRVPITTTPVIPTGPPPDLRLPRNVVPQSYRIFLRPLFYHTLTNETIQSFIFMGNSTVTFECLNKTRSIFLHSKDLTVKKLELTRLDNGEILTVNQHVNESTVSETDFLEVKLEDDAVLEPNRSYSLFADFEGEMFNDLTGFYTSTYEVENSNETRYLDVFFLSLLIKVWARREAIDDGHAKYADTVANTILNFYGSELGLTYPVGKLDHIALPDLAPAAMENWGLITYRESALLFAEGVSSTFDKEYIATLIAHQLAHQWFGNLVTMKWWNDLWLSEGFATYMSYQGLKHLEPSWNTEDLFVVNEVQRAFQVDALTAAYPLSPSEEEIQSLSEINGLFDTITYSKGASVLRMLSHYMSTGSFKEGIKKYLKALEYESADQYDLWTYLQEAETNIEEFMSTWTTQAGYPVFTVNTGTGDISQERFLLNSTGNKFSVVWHVPINLLKNDGSEGHNFLLKKAIGGPIPDLKRDKWIVVNINCTGYYRVNYDQGNWEGLMAQQKADHHAIPMINRAQLIDDAFNLARAKYIDVTLALNTTKYLKNETEYIPWNAAMKNLKYFILMFDRSEVYGPMQTYLKDQITNLYRHFENDTMSNTVPNNHLDQYAQLEAVTVACKVGLKECIDTATNMFNQWKENPYNTTTQIHPNLRYNVYCYAIADGGQAEWEFAWEKYLNSTIAAEKDKLRYGLSCTRHIWLLNRYLQYTLNPTKIRKIDTVSTIKYIASNVAGQALAWDFVRGNWKYFSEEHGGEIKFLGDLIDGVTERFSTEYELQQLKQFQYDSDLTGDSIGSASRALERAIERTQINIQWVKDNKDTVLDWFRSETK
ncbi:alanyl (membrane) aminopeptidase-like b [Alosa pseudoharengus]|uniref:alanyl (membrane) aminopeptidase-like b n=1 Tax=Alosa pseudoharengus TaxID=34774 RepID=UPI003F8CCDB5